MTLSQNFLAFKLDMTDNAHIDTALEATLQTFGRVDVVVNNAGYGSKLRLKSCVFLFQFFFDHVLIRSQSFSVLSKADHSFF
jgi:NAD(P)-dependent dehydrogenase (short-subunit alcohol dehydrogenase family)